MNYLTFATIAVFGLTLVLAAVEWWSVARRRRKLEYIFKPVTLIVLIVAAWLLTRGPHDEQLARWFIPGLILSLAGDVFLLIPGGLFFMLGLGSFLVAHVCYIAGLNPTLPPAQSLLFLSIVAVVGAVLFYNIITGMRRRGKHKFIVPVILYGAILSLMLLSAWATWFRPEWPVWRRLVVSAGGSLFFVSDSLLAWNLFVAPTRTKRAGVMITYHLAQMALAAIIAVL